MKNKLAVVTGAHGFLGRHTARYFSEQGWEVCGIGHGGWSQKEWRAWGMKEWHACDVTLDTLLVYAREPDLIVHCAGSGLVGFSMSHPVQDYRRGVETTLGVLEFARLHAPHTRILYPSSAAVYGIAEQMPITEDAPLRPVSPYGVHKKIAEELCLSYAAHFRVAAAIVRFFSVYGAELRKQLLWDACNKIRRHESLFTGTGEETRDWLHVSDAAALFFRAESYACSDCPVVNGGWGHPVTIREVLTEISKELCLPCVPQFNGLTRAGDPKHYQADIARARGWGWVPKIDWRSGIAEYVVWFKKDLN